MNRNADCGSCAAGKKKLFDEISALSFALDDLRLYLDTHPDCGDAMELFCEYQNQRRTLVDQYTKEYGPIEAYHVNVENGWSWVNEPMPWQGGV